MAAGAFFLLVLVLLALVAAAIVGLVVYATRQREGLSRQEKVELRELRALVSRLDRLAYGSREAEPILSFQIIDEISKSKQKELE